MATIGDGLTAPEIGWKRYDETHPAFNYIGAWTSYSNAGYYGGYSKYTNTIGNSVKFKFKGTKLRIIAEKHASRSASITVTIDGQSYSYSQQGAAAFQILLFDMNDLVVGVHDVEIKNTDGMYMDLDAIDIDSDGRLLHPDEVVSVNNLEIGKRIRCHYKAIPNVLGTFSNIGQETSNFIPTASSATPDGDFYFIMVEDWNGQRRLIADRNIQHSISWDILNNEGVASGIGSEWRFIKDWNELTNFFSFDEASGNVTDLKGTAVGTINGGVTRAIGWNGRGNALNFNGTNGYVAFNQKVIPIGKKSIRFKVKTNTVGGSTDSRLISTADATSETGLRIRININGQLVFEHLYSVTGTSNFYAVSTVLVNDGEWHDVLCTWDGTTSSDGVKLYVDNMLMTSPSSYSAKDVESEQLRNLVLGRNPNLSINSHFFSGTLDNIEIYDEVIKPDSESKSDESNFNIRLLTGGISSIDKDNEWDKYIVNSTLNGTIMAGDNNVWNWNSATSSWVSSTEKTPNKRVLRGGAQGAQYFTGDNNTLSVTSSASSFNGFRPMLLIESKIINRAFVQVDGKYKKWNGSEWLTVSETMPSVDTFISDGMRNISVLDRRQKVSLTPMINSGVLGEPLGNGKMFKGRINLNNLIEITSIEVKPNR